MIYPNWLGSYGDGPGNTFIIVAGEVVADLAEDYMNVEVDSTIEVDMAQYDIEVEM